MEEIPFEDRYVPKAEIDWDRSLWWWYPLTRAIHPAMRVTALVTSAIGILVLQRGLSFGNWLFAPRFAASFDNWYVRSLGSVQLAPIEIGQARLFAAIGWQEIGYLTFSLLWITAVFSFFGGILARRAAVELGQRTIAPWGETLRIVGSRMVSYIWVTGIHLVAIALLLVVPLLLGLLARLGPLAALAGVLLILFFPLVVAVGRLVLSMFICFPLAVTAIGCEKNADAFEGFSRSNNYFFQRPVVAALSIVALVAIGSVGYMIIFWLLLAGWHWVRDAFLAGAGYTITDLVGGETMVVNDAAVGTVTRVTPDAQATRLLRWVLVGGWLTRLLIAAYWFSYFWSATASVYLILRRSVDNTDLDEIDSPYEGAAAELPELPQWPQAPSTTPSSEPGI